MTETQIALAAKAIRKTLERTKGEATPWALARAALIAAAVSDRANEERRYEPTLGPEGVS